MRVLTFLFLFVAILAGAPYGGLAAPIAPRFDTASKSADLAVLPGQNAERKSQQQEQGRAIQQTQWRDRDSHSQQYRRGNRPRNDVQRAQRRRDNEQDRARDAVRRGDALPLDRIISRLRGYCPGRFLDANLIQNRGRLFYRIRILANSGRRVGIVVDAATGNVVSGQCG